MKTRALMSLTALLGLAGCATTPKPPPDETAPPPAVPAQTEQPQATSPEAAAPARPESVPATPLRQPKPMELVVLARPDTPIVSFRLVFHTGSVDDPKGKEGLTALTARLMAEGGTQKLSASQLLEALYPMAAELDVFVDKEFTAFSGRVHKDFLTRFQDIFTDVLLAPRLDAAELERLRANAISDVENGLRSANDEALGKVALDALIYEGHPYAHFTGGTVQGLKAITLDDVKAHAQRVFTQDRLVIGLAGAVDDALAQALGSRLSALPATGAPRVELPAVPTTAGRTVIIQKPTLSTAVSMGYVSTIRRGDPDFFPVAFAMSNLGEHRQSIGVLFTELREKRGLNYGDYAYAEHFIESPGTTYNRTNIARTQQDLSLWIRPVVPANGVFATRGAVFFLDQMVKEGIPQERFELMRGFLQGYTRLWEQTDQRRLGYAIDGLFYGTPDFLEQYRQAMSKMTPRSVQEALRRRVQPEALNFAFVTEDAQGLAKTLRAGEPKPITYASPKPEELLTQDRSISSSKLPLRPEAIQILPAQQFMEK
ncbi:M16 family metallopeptidase [Corallococcus macrosporus]|uniref:M16 family peptidase n=1 Tax=Myxococcus fulvus (strain ATCC BAA-855 / HW-1) TaxID=483219 RepID=F8CRK1_MYXFH|nr:pitrilysin family protein [Corallococcus macrosporus]AEI65546.1 M16 family peptidase [Corallococcus macrosporus]